MNTRRWHIIFILFFLMVSFPTFCPAANYHIEVLQVGNVDAFDDAVQAIKDELKKHGMIDGKNLVFNRTVIDADADAGLWQKAGILFKIKSKASKIVDSKPDLVVTVGTPATKYSKNKIIDAGIPVVFTCVAIPELAGCKSKDESGPGFTGATLYTDPKDLLEITQYAFPNLKTIGIVHSDDENAVGFVEEIKAKGANIGVNVLNREVNKSDDPTKACMDLIDKKIDIFMIPIDVYFALRNYEPLEKIRQLSTKHNVPLVSSIIGTRSNSRGALLYFAPDFKIVGGLTGQQIAKILLEKVKPETLPVMRQKNVIVHVDLNVLKNSNFNLPTSILELAQPLEQ